MIIENRIEKRSFGPFASSMGLFLFIGGLVISYFSLTGLLLSLIGAFIGFTSTCTIIDTDNKRIKHADYIFGFVPIGKWVSIKPDMKLGLKRVKRGYVGYIRGNQQVDIQYSDIRIFLYDSNNKKIMPIKKFQTYELAEKELKDMGSLLNLENDLRLK
jgi:predicted membrane protein